MGESTTPNAAPEQEAPFAGPELPDPSAPAVSAAMEADPGSEAGHDPDGSSETRSGGGGRTPYARRLEDPQRIDGGGRWSVDSTRRRCSRCERDLPDDQVFHTVLEPAPAEEGDDAPELFVRRDYCPECFESDPPAAFFAHWKSVLPPPAGGPRKIVNLASLLAHFHTLVETPDLPDVEESEFGDPEIENFDGDPDGDAAAASEETSTLAERLSPERLRLAYLLGLFLVRRRMLKWEGMGGGVLRLTCRESDRPVELPVPGMSEAELEAAVAEFEDLFR